MRIISIHSKFAMKIRNGGGLFFCTPRLCRRSVTPNTHTNFVLRYIGGGVFFATGSAFYYFVHTNSSFFGLNPVFRETILKKTSIRQSENYNCATGCCIKFLEKFMQIQTTNGQTKDTKLKNCLFLVTKLGSKTVPKYEVKSEVV